MGDDSLSKAEVYDVIIIGGGPAGLTSGIYTSRARLSSLLIEKLGLGGQASLSDKIENYPGFSNGISGAELVHNMEEQAKSFGTMIAYGEVNRIEFSEGSNIKKIFVDNDPVPYQCLSIIIAAGEEQRKLGVPGELEFTGKGVSYCATCDGAFFRDLTVAVVGGGDVALGDALFLTRFVQKVYIVHRRDRFRATKILQERVFNNGKIEVIFDSVVSEIFGQTMVGGVKLRNLKTGESKDLEVNGVFVFIGYVPSLTFLGTILKKSDDDYIIVDREMTTSREGIFACGDCCKKNLKQVVTACGDGATAAFSAQHYVERIKGEEYV
ncbi:MAG: thioredoxin-disulfide reductase [Deltaproteobacteria bacterium]|nr:thioredoxin-disulfide reductase [Deltaproteobacteria bacterium]MBW2339838.1 thioredoxin-disulfide reductase [Deltaproteobacteria bacterium]